MIRDVMESRFFGVMDSRFFGVMDSRQAGEVSQYWKKSFPFPPSPPKPPCSEGGELPLFLPVQYRALTSSSLYGRME